MESDEKKSDERPVDLMLKTIKGQVEKYTFIQQISMELLGDSGACAFLGMETIRAIVKVAVIHKEQVTVPYDWWQHFKQRWLPEFLLKRYPVKFRTFTFRTILNEKVDRERFLYRLDEENL